MKRKCCFCICRTCLNTCCNRKICTGKKDFCEKYKGFQQLSIFNNNTKLQYQHVPRHSWTYYGITKERYRQLTEHIQSEKYENIVQLSAHMACEPLAEYILLSITKKLSYEGLEKLWARGEIERIPYCRTDFYGIRRYFYSLFDKELRRIGK